jgi:hypothetical protein
MCEPQDVVMFSKINLACVGALTLLPHLAFAAEAANPWSIETVAPDDAMVAAADRLPTVSIESICRDAQSAALPESKLAAYQSCVTDERAAFDQLRQKCPHYPTGARVTCAEPGDGVPTSYVELQTCLEMRPGGVLTIEGPGPGAAPSLDTTASPAPVAGGPAGSNDGAATRVVPLMQTNPSPQRAAP